MVIRKLSFLSSLLILSFFIQFIINQIFLKKTKNINYWIFLDSGFDIKKVDSFNSLNLNNIKSLNIKDIINKNKILENSYGIIFNDFENLKAEEIDLLLEYKKKGIKIYNLTAWFKKFLKRYPPNLLKSKDLLEVDFLLVNNNLLMRIKRLGDIIVSISLLILTLPLILIASFLIYLEDRGPIFYSQERNGFLGSKFTVWKLRSMRTDAEKKGVSWSTKNDPRITYIGSLIRQIRLDELPQLWSVFIGDMSLIGPRPERPEFDKILISKLPFYSVRYLLRPGLSGWAQVNYPYGASINDSSNKLSFDIYYISNYSFWLDLLIVFKTLRIVFNARGSKSIN